MRVAGVWVHPVLTGRVLMMAGRFNGEVCMSALRELVDILAICRVHTLSVTAYGSGDEGSIEEYELTDEAGEEFHDANTEEYDGVIETLVEKAFEEKGFNYYDGNGGELQLNINVPERTCNWSAFVNDLVMCDDASDEETV